MYIYLHTHKEYIYKIKFLYMPRALIESKGEGHCDITCAGWDVCSCFMCWTSFAFFLTFALIITLLWIDWDNL